MLGRRERVQARRCSCIGQFNSEYRTIACLHSKLVASVENQAYYGSRIAELMGVKTLTSLYNRCTDDEAQAKDEQGDYQHRGKVPFTNDIVAQCLQSET